MTMRIMKDICSRFDRGFSYISASQKIVVASVMPANVWSLHAHPHY